MVGAALELYQATGEEQFLTTAESIAGFMTSNEVVRSRYGDVLSDGSNTSCGGDCHAFKGIAYRYLMRLYEETGRAEYGNVLRGSVDAIWNLARTPEDELFAVSWTGPPVTSYSEPQTVAAVMALNLYAMHAGPYLGSGIPADRYEAENATIRGVGLEAEHEGFTGWGYVAGWNGNGQRVDFEVETTVAGEHRLALRYAAGAGDATRLVRVDGDVVVADMAFPATESWADYAVVETAIDLTPGVHRISIAFETGRGSENFLNLDHISVRSLATPYFLRGDANADGLIEVSDALKVLLYGFLQAPIECEGAADVDDSGEDEMTDAIHLLNYLLLDAPPPPPPFPECGNDPTPDEQACDAFAPCF